ncbi:MAG: hypothetical protein GX630_09590, partial [Actinobacteria bacterium]|nr:hypothetical protein [Actinomycetota bacterium]
AEEAAQAALVPTHLGSELDEEPDDEGESDEFEGAPDLGPFDMADVDTDLGDIQLPSFADDSE